MGDLKIFTAGWLQIGNGNLHDSLQIGYTFVQLICSVGQPRGRTTVKKFVIKISVICVKTIKGQQRQVRLKAKL